MGGGAPLAFLNKKTWHPGRMQNLEEVWKREQAAAAEQRKLEELRKQYEDERKNAEFTQMAEQAGYRKEAKLDWMYAGSLAAKHQAQARQDLAAPAPAAPSTPGVPTAAALQHQVQQQEQPLVPAAAASRHQNDDLSRAERAAQLPSFLAIDTPASQNEQWARLHNDPLLAIKKQEQDALKKVRENPIKMQQILKEVEKVRSHKHKKEKKEKKDKKDKHRGRSMSPEHLQQHAGHKRGRPARSRSPTPPRAARVALQAPVGAPAADRYDRGTQGDHQAGRQYVDRQHSHGRHSSPRSRSRSRERPDSRSQRPGDRQEQMHSHHRRQPHVPHAGDKGRHDLEHPGGSHHRREGGSSRSHHHTGRHSGSIGTGGGGRYGLELATDRPRGGAGLDAAEMAAAAEARAAATRQRLSEAAAAKEAAAAAAAAAQRQQRRDYKTGKMTAEEKAAKLAEMMGNAADHDQQRMQRVNQARAAEDEDRGTAALLAKAAAAQAEDAFKSAAAAEVFGSLAGGGMGLDARISSRRHYHER